LLLDYVRPHRWALLAGALLSLVTGGTGLLLPLVARGLIDDLSHDRTITGALLAMSALVVANAALGALGSYVSAAHRRVGGARRAARPVVVSAAAADHRRGPQRARRPDGPHHLGHHAAARGHHRLAGRPRHRGLTLVATVVMMGLVDPVLLGVTLAVIAGAGTCSV
jgi:ABC-type multidrug transport system fused ATPase/permease subunit